MDLYSSQLDIVKKEYERGLRLAKLGPEAATWVRKGLKILEAGKELTVEDIERFSREDDPGNI
jgi:hypothetical protein